MNFKTGIPQEGDCLANIQRWLTINSCINIRYYTNEPKIIVVQDEKIYTWNIRDKPDGFAGW